MKKSLFGSRLLKRCAIAVLLVVCILMSATAAMAEGTVDAANYYGTGNPDAYAWIEIPELGLSCPILQDADDDAYYADHDAQGKKSDTGALFTQSTFNGTDFTDTMTTIYGSSQNDEDLFGGIQGFYTNDQNFFEDGYREVDIYVDGRVEKWVVFAALPYSPAHMEYYYDFENARVYKSFFDYLAAVRDMEANLDTTMFPDPGEQILCLSTSLKEDGTQAYTVFARRLEAVEKSQEKNAGVEKAKEQWNFTPSCSGKLAPEIKTVVMADGKKVEGMFKAGDELKDEINDYLVVTPVADREEAPEKEITERLDTAYTNIKDSESVGELSSVEEEKANIGFDLESILKKLNKKANAKNLVVRDLFDITPFGAYKTYMETDETYMDVTFDLHVNAGETVIAMESKDGENWTVISDELVTRNEDGSYTVRLYDMNVLSFLTEARTAEEIDTSADDAVLSPMVSKKK